MLSANWAKLLTNEEMEHIMVQSLEEYVGHDNGMGNESNHGKHHIDLHPLYCIGGRQVDLFVDASRVPE